MKLMPAAWCYYLLLKVMRGGLGWRLVARFLRKVTKARGRLLEPSLVLQVQQVGKQDALVSNLQLGCSQLWVWMDPSTFFLLYSPLVITCCSPSLGVSSSVKKDDNNKILTALGRMVVFQASLSTKQNKGLKM